MYLMNELLVVNPEKNIQDARLLLISWKRAPISQGCQEIRSHTTIGFYLYLRHIHWKQCDQWFGDSWKSCLKDDACHIHGRNGQYFDTDFLMRMLHRFIQSLQSYNSLTEAVMIHFTEVYIYDIMHLFPGNGFHERGININYHSWVVWQPNYMTIIFISQGNWAHISLYLCEIDILLIILNYVEIIIIEIGVTDIPIVVVIKVAVTPAERQWLCCHHCRFNSICVCLSPCLLSLCPSVCVSLSFCLPVPPSIRLSVRQYHDKYHWLNIYFVSSDKVHLIKNACSKMDVKQCVSYNEISIMCFTTGSISTMYC